MTLGTKIKLARQQCGLSQEQLAKKLCVSRSAIAKWETDKGLPDIGNLKPLSRLLNVTVDQLLDEEAIEDRTVLRERCDLSVYGGGCRKLQKDRLVRERFLNARIRPLLARREMPPRTAGCAAGRDPDREFYLVEQGSRQLLVTVMDTVLEIRSMEPPTHDTVFSRGGWHFVRCNYEIV